jgi:dTDP-glucose 4,6-dehydratase
MPTVISNCSNNYGPNQYPEKLIPVVIDKIYNKKPIPVYGKGYNIRDWLYVTDHAQAIDNIFHNGKPGETSNIGGNCEKTNMEIVNTLIKVTDKLLGRPEGESLDLITFVTDRPGHDLRYAIDSSKLQTELGWSPQIEFEEGIEKTVKWYLNNKWK